MLRPAAVLLTVFSLLCGLVYPAVITGFAQVLFPHQANGSLVTVDGKAVGSALIGQAFSGDDVFWSRPSATTPAYNGASSSGSNLGPSSPALKNAVEGRVVTLQQTGTGAIPVDLVTASGSGLDPDISLAAALYQVPRVARARHLDETRVRALVERQVTRSPLVAARVNVLALNLELVKELPGE